MRPLFKFSEKSGQRAIAPLCATTAEPPTSDRNGRELLDRIGNFLLGHALDVNPANLNLAHAAFSNCNSRLGRQIIQRELANEPITQAWLDDIGNERAGDEQACEKLDQLMDRLDKSLQYLSRNANAARRTATLYQTALEEAAILLERNDLSLVDIAMLSQLTHSMIERADYIEQEMQRSEGDALCLRASFEHACQDAEGDALTGPPNRHSFEAVLETECRMARKAGEPLCIAFCDIDSFKLINDMHGHDAGDRVIKAIGRALQRISGQNCHIARHRGEEFALLFPCMTLAQAHEELDKVRDSFAHRQLIDRKTETKIGIVTFSAGIADAFAYDDLRTALQAADEALDRAKETGRNRIVVADLKP